MWHLCALPHLALNLLPQGGAGWRSVVAMMKNVKRDECEGSRLGEMWGWCRQRVKLPQDGLTAWWALLS